MIRSLAHWYQIPEACRFVQVDVSLKIETSGSSEILVPTYHTAWRPNKHSVTAH